MVVGVEVGVGCGLRCARSCPITVGAELFVALGWLAKLTKAHMRDVAALAVSLRRGDTGAAIAVGVGGRGAW